MRDGHMNTNNCTEITDSRCRGLTNGATEAGKQHQGFGFIIPAAILLGLGVGILVDLVWSGILVGLGLGLGFLGSGLLPFSREQRAREGMQPGSMDVTMLLVGAFLVFIGISLVLAPAALWSFAFAGFIILMGIWFLVRGFYTLS